MHHQWPCTVIRSLYYRHCNTFHGLNFQVMATYTFSFRGLKRHLWQISCPTLEPSGVNCIAVPSLPPTLHKRGELLLHTCQSPHHITAWGDSLLASHVSGLNSTYYMHTSAACRPSGRQTLQWCSSLHSYLVCVDASLHRNGYKVNTHVAKLNFYVIWKWAHNPFWSHNWCAFSMPVHRQWTQLSCLAHANPKQTL